MKRDAELVLLGAKIRVAREKKGLSQEDFAKQCGLTKNYIGMLERGERNPSYLTLLKIVNGHNLSLSQLL